MVFFWVGYIFGIFSIYIFGPKNIFGPTMVIFLVVLFLVQLWLYFWSKHGYIFGGFIFGPTMVIFLLQTWLYFWSNHGYIFGPNMVIFLVVLFFPLYY